MSRRKQVEEKPSRPDHCRWKNFHKASPYYATKSFWFALMDLRTKGELKKSVMRISEADEKNMKISGGEFAWVRVSD